MGDKLTGLEMGGYLWELVGVIGFMQLKQVRAISISMPASDVFGVLAAWDREAILFL